MTREGVRRKSKERTVPEGRVDVEYLGALSGSEWLDFAESNYHKFDWVVCLPFPPATCAEVCERGCGDYDGFMRSITVVQKGNAERMNAQRFRSFRSQVGALR